MSHNNGPILILHLLVSEGVNELLTPLVRLVRSSEFRQLRDVADEIINVHSKARRTVIEIGRQAHASSNVTTISLTSRSEVSAACTIHKGAGLHP